MKRVINTVITTLTLIVSLMAGQAIAGEIVTYYHLNNLGSPVAATDESGAIKWREHYQPYGERLLKEGDAENSIWFTGKQEEIGLTYMGARWYDPELGRFLEIDPVGFHEGNPQSFNRYAYANNNPYRYVDPNGETPLDIGFLLVDVVKLGGAIYSGVGIGAALADVAISAVGVASPIPGTGLAIKAGKVAKAAKAVKAEAKVTKTAKKTYYSKKKRLEAHKNADGKCEYCGKDTQTDTPFKSDSAEGDHFIPQAKGGSTTTDQLVNSCRQCNGLGGKGSKMPGTEWQPSNPNPRIQDKMNKL